MKFADFWPFTKRSKPKGLRRGYDAAQFNRLLASWVASLSSEDSVTKAALPQLRARSRDLARNNDYVKNAIRIIQNNVVGSGIPFQAQVRKQRGAKFDEVMNTAIEDLWTDWSKAWNCHTGGKYSFRDIETVVMSSVVKNGEVFIRMHRRKFGSSKVPFALELINADLLDENYNERFEGGREIRMGVERDEFGRPVAYHFHRSHPNELNLVGAPRLTERIRVPASDIIHLMRPESEDQTRGVPWFASAMMRLHHMGGYEQATVVGARARAAIMGFIETPDGQLQGDDVDADQRVTDFEPGVFKQLNPGEKVNVPNIAANAGELDPFMKFMLRGVAAGCGMSYESLSKDYQGATYSSARQALLEDRDLWKTLQQWIIESFHQRVFEQFLLMAYLEKAIALPLFATNSELYTRVRWQPRGFPWIDPLKEVEAYAAAVRNGFMTVTDVVAQNGGDINEQSQVRARELELFKELGLKYDTDPANDAPEPPAMEQSQSDDTEDAADDDAPASQSARYYKDGDGNIFRMLAPGRKK